jgi:Tol biopolymer transport system component
VLAQYPNDWTSDGSALLFNDDTGAGGSDIWLMSRSDQRPLVATPASELNVRLSPNQRWLAYMSNESGRMEVYVRPFPEVSGQRWRVSALGGHTPRWAHSGRELFYMQGGQLMVVPVDSRAASFVAGRQAMLFSGPFDTTQDNTTTCSRTTSRSSWSKPIPTHGPSTST